MHRRCRVKKRIVTHMIFLMALLFGATAIAASPHFSLSPEEFAEEYWERPIPLQGRAPDSFSSLESSLHPKDCGACHQSQYADWSGSLHSIAVGPGLMGAALSEREPELRHIVLPLSRTAERAAGVSGR